MRLRAAQGRADSPDNAYEFLMPATRRMLRNICSASSVTVTATGLVWRRSILMWLKAINYDDIGNSSTKTLFQSPIPPELKQRMIVRFEKIKAGY